MSAGRIVETGKTSDLFRNPQHKVTKDLLASILSFDGGGAGAASANPDSGSPWGVISSVHVGCRPLSVPKI